jgi:hypothetical protein
MATRIKARTGKLYETDFFLWTKEQAAALRAGRLDALDRDNLAEEVESLGRKDRRELESRLTVLVMHLLKWRYQPDQRSGSWDSTIRTQRREIQKLLHDSPSLRPAVAEALEDGYDTARRNASAEAHFALDALPATCPFELEQILADEWLP